MKAYGLNCKDRHALRYEWEGGPVSIKFASRWHFEHFKKCRERKKNKVDLREIENDF